jgi:hypothetical protein
MLINDLVPISYKKRGRSFFTEKKDSKKTILGEGSTDKM